MGSVSSLGEKRRMNTATFLQLLYDDPASGDLVLWPRQDKKARWLPAGDLETVGRLAEHLSATCDVYFGVAVQDKGAAFARWRRDNPGNPEEPTTRGYT